MHSSRPSKDDPSVKADGEASAETTTSQEVLETSGSYSTDLIQAFASVSRKAKSGVQMCHAVSAFVTERARVESDYAQALLKLTQNAKAEDWSEQFTRCWDTFCTAIEHVAQVRCEFASTLQTVIVPETEAFTVKQERQVQKMIAEGVKARRDQKQITALIDKARKKYNRKCHGAIELIAVMRRSDSVSPAHAYSSLLCQLSSEEVSASKELTEKLASGAGHLLTKMWDTTSAFGRNPLERQRAKLYVCLEEVISSEKLYLQAVEITNAQRLDFERRIKENLRAFQLTEEQRLEFLRDILMRMQQAFVDIFPQSQQFVEQMKMSINQVDELGG
uniref:F-BAR domain-containing protein n=1 Tax=Hyaloperonospora arabidopsidis (strain Emoy2) TaxID=559515 RepID=M4B6Z1_HYAAE